MTRKGSCALEPLLKACFRTTTVILEPYKACCNAKSLRKRYFIWIGVHMVKNIQAWSCYYGAKYGYY